MEHGRSRVLPLQAVDRGRRRRTTAGRRRKRHSRVSCQRTCARRGSDCVRPRPSWASSGSTPRTTRSCSRARPAISSSVPRRASSRSAYSWAGPSKSPHVRRSDRSSKSKFVNIIQIKHRDQVEAPITDWLREAYELSEALATKPKAAARTTRPATPKPRPSRPRRKTAAAKKRRPSAAKVSSRSVSLRSRRRR